jgi:hypothetical protein
LTGLALRQVVSNPALVAFGGTCGEEAYPAAQFLAGGRCTPNIDAVRSALAGRVDEAELAAFVTMPSQGLGGSTPLRWLQNGGDVDRVIKLASS